MEWVEIIHLRANTNNNKKKALAAFSRLTTPAPHKGLRGIKLFQNPTLNTDLSIFISWKMPTGEPDKSSLGQRLAAAFSEFGLIKHSLWKHSKSIHQT